MRSIFLVLFFLFCSQIRAQLSDLYTVSKLGISENGIQEFNLVTFAKGGYFISNRSNYKFTKITDTEENALSGIFRVSSINSGLESPDRLPLKIEKHIGSFTISTNEDQIIFTAGSELSKDKMALYQSDLVNGKWTAPIQLFTELKDFNLLDPFLSIGKDTLYFAADFAESVGGTDIYRAVLKNGIWSEISNLGATINSISNERFPHFRDSRLYFSSNRANSFGGLDLYSSLRMGNEFMTVYHFPSPVNSEADDFSLSSASDSIAWFSSSRQGSDDLYEMKFTYPELECQAYIEPERCFEFYESNAGFEDTSSFSFEWSMGDGKKYTGLEADHCYADSGFYVIELNVIDVKSGDVFYNQATFDFLLEDAYQLPLAFPDTIALRTGFSYNLHKTFPKDSSKIYWNMGDGNLKNGAEIRHLYSVEGEYLIAVTEIYYKNGQEFAVCTEKTIKVVSSDILISSVNKANFAHTKNRLEEVQQEVIENHETDVQYLLEIVSSETKIPDSLHYFDPLQGKYLVEEHFDHEKNKFSYSVGSQNEPTALYEDYKQVKSLGYVDSRVVGKTMTILTLSDLDTVSEKTLEYAIIRVPAILFASNSFEIPKEAYGSLDKLVKFMNRFPEINIEVSAHTDNVGRIEKNIILSHSRAREIAQYFEKQNISHERIVTVGYGDTKPIADNATSEGKTKNRRVEFRIFK